MVKQEFYNLVYVLKDYLTLLEDWSVEEGKNKSWRTSGVCYRSSEEAVIAWVSVAAVEEGGVESEK